LRRRWLVRAVLLLTGLGALTGYFFGIALRSALPDLGPVEVFPRDSILGPVVVRTPLDWTFYVGGHMAVFAVAGLGFAAIMRWANTYIERDVFAPEPLAPGPT
jgi:hypothetical protein